MVSWSDGSKSLIIGSEVFDIFTEDFQAPSYLFVRQGKIVGCETQLQTKIQMKPASLSSLSHQKLTQNIKMKHTKEKKVRLIESLPDPEVDREKREAEQTLTKARDKKKNSFKQGMTSDLLEGGSSEDSAEELSDDDEKEKKTRRRSVDDEESERKILKSKEGKRR
jgi:RNA polymerase-associated protein LEO1